jgi:hypothetical protein
VYAIYIQQGHKLDTRRITRAPSETMSLTRSKLRLILRVSLGPFNLRPYLFCKRKNIRARIYIGESGRRFLLRLRRSDDMIQVRTALEKANATLRHVAGRAIRADFQIGFADSCRKHVLFASLNSVSSFQGRPATSARQEPQAISGMKLCETPTTPQRVLQKTLNDVG